jgi:hypothetical protein
MPTPNVSVTRPPERTSSVDTAFARSTGWWYGSTITAESTRIRVVAPARNAIAVNACGQCAPMVAVSGVGTTRCSETEIESNPSSSAVRAIRWKSVVVSSACHGSVSPAYRLGG